MLLYVGRAANAGRKKERINESDIRASGREGSSGVEPRREVLRRVDESVKRRLRRVAGKFVYRTRFETELQACSNGSRL